MNVKLQKQFSVTEIASRILDDPLYSESMFNTCYEKGYTTIRELTDANELILDGIFKTYYLDNDGTYKEKNVPFDNDFFSNLIIQVRHNSRVINECFYNQLPDIQLPLDKPRFSMENIRWFFSIKKDWAANYYPMYDFENANINFRIRTRKVSPRKLWNIDIRSADVSKIYDSTPLVSNISITYSGIAKELYDRGYLSINNGLEAYATGSQTDVGSSPATIDATIEDNIVSTLPGVTFEKEWFNFNYDIGTLTVLTRPPA